MFVVVRVDRGDVKKSPQRRAPRRRRRRRRRRDRHIARASIVATMRAPFANDAQFLANAREFNAWRASVFPLPSLTDLVLLRAPFPSPGTAEFVNVITVLGVGVAMACVAFDAYMRARRAMGRERARSTTSKESAAKARKTTLPEDGSEIALRVTKREQISRDTIRLTFALPSATHALGLPVGQHVAIVMHDESTGERTERPYTPTSSDDDLGVVVFVVKVYKPCEKFPLGGKVSQYLDTLKVGDKCTFYGPKGMKTYAGRGKFLVKQLKSQGGGFETRECKKIGMIAGGSGITPMLQISRAILDHGDDIPISLLFANQTEGDILCRDEIEADVAKFGEDKFRTHYTLDRPPESGWKYSSGFITKDMIAKHMPPPGKDTQILICGPPPMLKFAVLPALEELGYTKEMYLTW